MQIVRAGMSAAYSSRKFISPRASRCVINSAAIALILGRMAEIRRKPKARESGARRRLCVVPFASNIELAKMSNSAPEVMPAACIFSVSTWRVRSSLIMRPTSLLRITM